MTNKRLKILVSAFCCDAYDVSEDLDGFNWVKELSRHCDVTLFTLGRPGRACGTEGMPHVETHLYPQTRLGVRHPQLERTLLPSYLPFSWFSYRKAREAMRRERFDLVHQVTPGALRFASSMALLGLPFVLGPVGGGVAVPNAFKSDLGGEPLYFKLRGLDRLRLRTDPTLLYTLSKASKVLVQGEYAAEMLPASARAKCEVMLGAGFDSLPPVSARNSKAGALNVLYVGRVIATKGLRYVVRGLARVSGVDWRLTVVGDGPDMETVKKLAGDLGVADRIAFAGSVPHAEVARFYAAADVFAFPSLKEAGGNVVLEAMSHGLPVIVVDHGGPATTVTPDCGYKLPPTSVEAVVAGIAEAAKALAASPETRSRMGEAGRKRISDEYLWEAKGRRIMAVYGEAIALAAERGKGHG